MNENLPENSENNPEQTPQPIQQEQTQVQQTQRSYNPVSRWNPNDPQVMSVKDWMITLLLGAIPMVGFIMYLIWAFGDDVNPNKANYAKAYLLFTLIMIGVVILVYVLIFAGMMAFIGADAFGS